MKKETFIGIMRFLEKTIKDYEKFGKTISKAYVELGSDSDFVTSSAFELPYGKICDEMAHILAVDFENDIIKATDFEDVINWWMWETEFGKKTFYKYPNLIDTEEHSAPELIHLNHFILSNGEERSIKTAADLYKLLKDLQKQNSEDNGTGK